MRIIDGIKIFTALDVRNQIFLSNGIQKVTALNDEKCNQVTFVPKSPWRQPSDNEFKILTHNDQNKIPYQSIGIIKLPEVIRKNSHLLDIQNSNTPDDFYQKIKCKQYDNLITDILKFVDLYKSYKGAEVICNIGCFPKGLETITKNKNTNTYIGLHIDSWDRKPIKERANASNRVCFNIGKGRRSFLFINQEIKDLINFVGNRQYQNYDHQGLIGDFMKLNKSYPVVKIELNPFEGYIAPTENLIHDGSSTGQDVMDINLSIRSFFNVKPKHVSEN